MEITNDFLEDFCKETYGGFNGEKVIGYSMEEYHNGTVRIHLMREDRSSYFTYTDVIQLMDFLYKKILNKNNN